MKQIGMDFGILPTSVSVSHQADRILTLCNGGAREEGANCACRVRVPQRVPLQHLARRSSSSRALCLTRTDAGMPEEDLVTFSSAVSGDATT